MEKQRRNIEHTRKNKGKARRNKEEQRKSRGETWRDKDKLRKHKEKHERTRETQGKARKKQGQNKGKKSKKTKQTGKKLGKQTMEQKQWKRNKVKTNTMPLYRFLPCLPLYRFTAFLPFCSSHRSAVSPFFTVLPLTVLPPLTVYRFFFTVCLRLPLPYTCLHTCLIPNGSRRAVKKDR